MKTLPKILLIEDNEDDYEAIVRSLRRNHVSNPVVWCQSGQEALDYFAREGRFAAIDCNKAHLILLDLNMPGIDGKQVLSTVKADEKTCRIPVVVLTTSADERDINDCYQLGASTYIQKPVGFESLTEAMQTVKNYWFEIAILPQRFSEW